jgi:hypothetical protein
VADRGNAAAFNVKHGGALVRRLLMKVLRTCPAFQKRKKQSVFCPKTTKFPSFLPGFPGINSTRIGHSSPPDHPKRLCPCTKTQKLPKTCTKPSFTVLSSLLPALFTELFLVVSGKRSRGSRFFPPCLHRAHAQVSGTVCSLNGVVEGPVLPVFSASFV